MTKGLRRHNCSCLVCGSGFYCPPSRQAIGHGKYCSKRCMGDAKKGKADPNLTHRWTMGNEPWNKGKGRKDIQCGRCGKTISVLESQGTQYCSRDCAYASFRVPDDRLTSYMTIHSRVRERFGTPSECEHCGTTDSPKFEWANLTGKYLLDREDWMRLCCKCHRRYDLGTTNKIEVGEVVL